jgi:hypothetical protein
MPRWSSHDRQRQQAQAADRRPAAPETAAVQADPAAAETDRKADMTPKQFDFDSRGNPIKKAGWHSWRHPTREAQDEARERYLATHATARARLARKERLRLKRLARRKAES